MDVLKIAIDATLRGEPVCQKKDWAASTVDVGLGGRVEHVLSTWTAIKRRTICRNIHTNPHLKQTLRNQKRPKPPTLANPPPPRVVGARLACWSSVYVFDGK